MGKLLFLIKPKLASSEQGFSLFEVLISILMASAFVLGTLQAMAINAFLQVKTEREGRANFWMQDDLELVRSEAATIQDSNKCYPLSFNAGYANELNTRLRSKYSATRNANNQNLPISLTSGNIQVVATDIGILTNATDNKADRNFINSQSMFRLVRKITPDNRKPNILKITYEVGKPHPAYANDPDARTATATDNNNDGLRDDSTIATLYAEVMPNGALNCPAK